MQLHGYHSISEISAALSVSEPWLTEQLEEFMGDRQLTLFGEPHYLHSDIVVWVNRMPDALKQEQKRMRDLAAEVTPAMPYVILGEERPHEN